ncbi:dihydropteroate synthase [Legionella lansingensis]|uniref:Dihydropteroate synthase n=1 Tax=Legionella lansingensis TaxID=45067 RepID=A0A0W0VRR7_9GAMM|nr:dihydropteroate synthase [Legionella lansingensis]KTD22669.1 7,8-dihydropteroate synthase [Legionella lansingensis]SNV55732.1 dihydropteroate synthase [Legionella lansingensis]
MNNEEFKQWCRRYNPSDMNASPIIMGILNITPDSFSDGGKYLQRDRAVEHAQQMIAQGADIIDVGGESSRPGAESVSYEEEISRVIPVIEKLRNETDVAISIDTTKASVMAEAVAAGAILINDITALAAKDSLQLAAKLDVPVCLMHMQGKPNTMQHNPCYADDVLDEINCFFEQKIKTCLSAGIRREHLILDPGFGFGKLPQHNLRIVHQLEKLKQHNLPLMLGASRKTTLGVVLQRPVDDRIAGGLTIAIVAALQGVAILRTHDVDATRQALIMLQAIIHESVLSN